MYVLASEAYALNRKVFWGVCAVPVIFDSLNVVGDCIFDAFVANISDWM